MKKIFFLVILQVVTTSIHSQSLTKRFFAEAQLSYVNKTSQASVQQQNYPDVNSNVSYSISPVLGFSINEKLAAGLESMIQHREQSNADIFINNGILTSTINNDHTDQISFSPFLRYRIRCLDNFYFTINFRLTGGKSKTDNYIQSKLIYNSESIFYGATLGPGLQWAFSKHLSLVASLGYFRYIHEQISQPVRNDKNLDESISTNQFDFLLISSFSVGASYYF